MVFIVQKSSSRYGEPEGHQLIKLINCEIVQLFWNSGGLYWKATCAMKSFPIGTIFHLAGTLKSKWPECGSGVLSVLPAGSPQFASQLGVSNSRHLGGPRRGATMTRAADPVAGVGVCDPLTCPTVSLWQADFCDPYGHARSAAEVAHTQGSLLAPLNAKNAKYQTASCCEISMSVQ